jgi:hypothetical protein
MTAASTPSLHPSLRKLAAKYQGLLRSLSMVLFLTISGGMIAMMAIAFSSGDFFNLLLLGVIGLILMPMVALLSWLLRYLDRTLSRQLAGASQLLWEKQPIAARLAPTGSTSKMGTLVTLDLLTGKPAHAGPLHALINPSFRWSRPPRQEIAVQLYCSELNPGSELVALRSDDAPLLGQVVDREVYERRMRLLKIAVLVLLGAVLAGILIFGGVGR